MPREIQINLGLKPVTRYDDPTKRFIIYYEEFPMAIAVGENEDEAERNLIFLVEDMWKKRPNDLKVLLMEGYMDKIKINSSAHC